MDPPLAIGALSTRFEVLALAGEGGMGRVYRARERASGRVVALKLLPATGGDAVRFAREATVLARLELPGVVRHLDHGVDEDGQPFLVMEWLSGHDLGDRLQRGRLSIAETVTLARRVATTLGAAHGEGVVHRDLKPANLFLVDGDLASVKIVDFGLARPLGDPSLSTSQQLLGTPAYMSPEQVRGDEVDARADVYSLGAVLFRCAAGRLPFQGAHPLAVLAKVMVEAAPRLGGLCDAPPALDELIARMLSKRPEERPPDGRALAEELAQLGVEARVAPRVPVAITARERRVECVVLCAGASRDDDTRPTAAFASHEDRARKAMAELGGEIEALARGAWLVTVRGAASPAEQAIRAARCALLLREARPGSPVVVATGQVVAAGDQQVGEVLDRAALALVAARDASSTGILIDAATAAQLDNRFDVRGGGAWRSLAGEADAAAPARTLLGRSSACVGREMPLATLDAAATAAFEEPSARLALIVAAAGMGKSRMVAELIRTRIRSRGEVDVLATRGEGQRVATSMGLVGRILRAAAHVGPGLRPDDAARAVRVAVARDLGGADPRAAELLSELAGVVAAPEPTPTSRPARVDPTIAADATRAAFCAWLAGRTEGRPTLLVVEDLHWADSASVHLVSAALEACADRPLFVVATSRPDLPPTLREALRPALELSLGPLAARAAERLVREALGESATSEEVALILARAAGHPFQLEELVRAFAEGKGPAALPDSVLGMVQARLDGADSEARRVLRAASVFGDGFTAAGVAALLGVDAERSRIERAITELLRLEMVTRRRTPGGDLLGFTHALVRDAAYAMLDDADRLLAHRLAGSWLEAAGETEATVLADHFERGGATAHAGELYALAARVALERGDFSGAIRDANRALGCGPDSEQRGVLTGIHAAALYWSGDLDVAAARAAEAAAEVTVGGTSWFEAVAIAVGACGQRGLNDEVAAWLERAASVTAGSGAREAQLVALSRGAVQLLWAHHAADFEAILARVEAAAADGPELTPFAAGWVNRVRGETAWVRGRDVGRCLASLDASCTAFDRAGAARDACLSRLNLASLSGWAGLGERGLALVDQARADAARQRSGFLAAYAGMVGGFVQLFAGVADAERTLREALPLMAASPRLTFVARVGLSHLALQRGDPAEAEAHAVAAGALAVAAEIAPAAAASRSRALAARGLLDQALICAEEACAAAGSTTDLDLFEGLAALAMAEVLAARGDAAGSKAAALAGHEQLEALARTIQEPEGRAAFWSQRLVHRPLAALAR